MSEGDSTCLRTMRLTASRLSQSLYTPSAAGDIIDTRAY